MRGKGETADKGRGRNDEIPKRVRDDEPYHCELRIANGEFKHTPYPLLLEGIKAGFRIKPPINSIGTGRNDERRGPR